MNWEGLLSLNKTKGETSHAVVEDLRRILKYKKIGHTGTLDPLATGLLLLCLGKAVKIAQFLQDFDKEYIAKIRLGIVTDTYDVEGKVLKTEDKLDLQPSRIKQVVKSFQGKIEQTPPIYSALRHKGKRLYHYAREGKEVKRNKRKIQIKRIDNIDIDLPFVGFRVLCSKGTYIRSLANDLGKELGCGASLFSLCRTKIGFFKVEDSLTINNVEDLLKLGKLKEHIYSIEEGLSYLPAVSVDEDLAKRIKAGVEIKVKDIKSAYNDFEKGDIAIIKNSSGKILAVVKALISSEEMKKTRGQEKIFEYKRVLI